VKRSFWIRLAAVGFLALFVGSEARSIGITPVPTYCEECKPCTSDTDCGGSSKGVCWPYPHYPCSSGRTCSCR
jgi:hypothetical protein